MRWFFILLANHAIFESLSLEFNFFDGLIVERLDSVLKLHFILIQRIINGWLTYLFFAFPG